VIEDYRGGNFVFAKQPRRLGVVRATEGAVRRGDEHGGNRMVVRIAVGVGVGVRSIRGSGVWPINHINLEVGKGFGVEIVILENVAKGFRGHVFAVLTCFALCVFDRRT